MGHWSTAGLPRTILLKKTDSRSSHQLSVVPQLGVSLGTLLSWDAEWLHLVLVTTAAVSLWVHLSCHVHRTLFLPGLPQPLALTIFPTPLPQDGPSLGEVCDEDVPLTAESAIHTRHFNQL